MYHKLQILVCGLRVYRLHRVIEQFPQAFLICAYHIEILHGSLLGACPVNTKLGKEIWQLVRRICGTINTTQSNELHLTQSIIA